MSGLAFHMKRDTPKGRELREQLAKWKEHNERRSAAKQQEKSE